jgi:hypothetical protein
MLIQDSTSSTTEIPIPTPKVQIHRRKSTSDKLYNPDFLKGLLTNFRKRSSIPRVELAYQPAHQPNFPLNQELNGARPSTSPMSVILKSDQPEIEIKKFQRVKNRELPLIKMKRTEFNRDFSVSGNSVTYCDWVGLLLNNSKLPVSSTLNEKMMTMKKPRNEGVLKMNRRLRKGRCLLLGKLYRDNLKNS